jgi:hypothetical protein
MTRQSRIRWNSDERAAIVRRAQTILAQNPQVSGTILFKESQECLPMERRREAFGNAVAWLRQEVKKAGPMPTEVKVWRAPQAAHAEGQPPSPPASAAPSTTSSAGAPPGTAGPSTSPALAHMIEFGVQVITGILGDPRVKAAVSGLFQAQAATEVAEPAHASGDAAGAAELPTPELAVAPDRPRGEFVVVAGCSALEAKSLAKEVDGTLDVRFWASDEPRERLLELLPGAEVVFGVADGIPKAIESSLSRLGDRYVRHTGSVKGLYRRLAEQAMR